MWVGGWYRFGLMSRLLLTPIFWNGRASSAKSLDSSIAPHYFCNCFDMICPSLFGYSIHSYFGLLVHLNQMYFSQSSDSGLSSIHLPKCHRNISIVNTSCLELILTDWTYPAPHQADHAAPYVLHYIFPHTQSSQHHSSHRSTLWSQPSDYAFGSRDEESC